MPNFINIENEQNKKKMKNFFLIYAWFWFIWILFHFTIIFFFWLVLQSILLTWLFLWLWNFIAFVIDIPIWVSLKYIRSKTMLIIWIILLLFEALIFFKFILFTNISLGDNLSKIASIFDYFINSTTNLILAILCWVFYWVIKEIFDITCLSYTLDNSTNDELPGNLSKSNIYFGGGALFWLVLSWVILSLNPIIAVIILIVFIFLFFAFILIFFDNQEFSISLENIKNFKLNEIINWKKEVSTINKERLKEIFKKVSTLPSDIKPIFINPMKLKNKFEFKEFLILTKEEFQNTKKAFFSKPYFIPLVWVIIVLNFYWFLDTFISTFQVTFLEKILWENKDSIISKLANAYMLLWILVLPAFIMQDYFIKLSKKVWILNVMKIWILLSWISLIWFWITQKIFFVILCWIWNSIGYAAVMPLSLSGFSEKYSEHYAHLKNLKEIDSNVSASPLKMLLNLWNVLGLLFWSLIVSIFNFNWFFIIYWIILLILLFYTIKEGNKIKI